MGRIVISGPPDRNANPHANRQAHLAGRLRSGHSVASGFGYVHIVRVVLWRFRRYFVNFLGNRIRHFLRPIRR
jgi:hypothetical protein